ncbi:MAG: hypothetical protein ACYDGN_07145 [Acidimicrobiales bacterium]
MDESEAVERDSVGVATPIFGVYRRGYDPEQVDRYVADQQRRLDEALHRASESERKLAAAVGQLRELHRRVAVYESEARSAQPPALDTLGERVQRILQEAWEGAYNLRQEAEREVNELREQTQQELQAQREQVERDVEELRQVASKEASDLVDEATRRALTLRDEMDRRRDAYLERVERDRQRAVSQITFLYDQRQLAIAELARLQTTVQATIEEMVRSPLGKPAAAIADSAAARGPDGRSEPEAEIDQAGEDEQSERLFAADAVLVGTEDDQEQQEEAVAAESGHGGLLDQIIDDPDVDVTPEELEATDLAVPAPWDHDVTAVADSPTVPGIEDMPTGPMETLEYGYGPGRHTAGAAAAADVELADDEVPVSEPNPHHYGGVYDAEADGWG